MANSAHNIQDIQIKNSKYSSLMQKKKLKQKKSKMKHLNYSMKQN